MITIFLALFSMLKCSNIPKYQNMSQGVKVPNTPKSKYVPVGKMF